MLSHSGSSTGELADGAEQSGSPNFEKSIKTLLITFEAGLKAEGWNKGEVEARLYEYRQHLNALATQSAPLVLADHSEAAMKNLAAVFGDTYLQAINAAKKGQSQRAKDYAAISMRLLTEAYVQAGLSEGSMSHRRTVAHSLFSSVFLTSLLSMAPELLLPKSFQSEAFLTSLVIVAGSVTGQLINLYREAKVQLSLDEDLEAFMPVPFEHIVRVLDEKLASRALINDFWKRASVIVEFGKIQYELELPLAINSTRSKLWQVVPFSYASTTEANRTLKLVADHLEQISGEPLRNLIGIYTENAEALTRCRYLSTLGR